MNNQTLKNNFHRITLAVAFTATLAFSSAFASSGGASLDHAPNLSGDNDALQRGAKLFINYCLNCHSANSVRFNTLTQIGYDEKVISENLVFTGSSINDMMTLPTKVSDAQKWFGIKPPDLSTAARVRTSDWLYTFLRSFYVDEKVPHGFNNKIFHNTAMPNALWQLQGVTKINHETGEIEIASAGKRTREEFDKDVAELTAFITWMSDPTKSERQTIGIYVLIFMLIMTVLTYLLKREFWKDVKQNPPQNS